MRRVAYYLFAIILVAALAAAGVFLWGYAEFARPGPLASPTTVVIPKGAGVAEIAETLNATGVIVRPAVFRAGVRLLGAAGTLRAGEYAFAPETSMRDVVALLQSGKTVVRRVTVVEGMTSAQVAAQLAAVGGLDGELADVPEDGTLLPETYHYSYGDTRDEMVRRMTTAMDEALDELWAGRAEGLPFDTPREAVILASIIEKETGIAAERARIAAVFVNRLRKGMRLQSDPTVVYALTGGAGALGRPLTRDDLKTDSPYNTYVNAGLPPGPICNPGPAALAAALNPARSDELYFVADGTGGHVFARTLAEHNRNVARWRRIQRDGLEPAGDAAP